MLFEENNIFFFYFWELLGPFGGLWMHIEGFLSHFENSTEYSVLFPEITQIREISQISGAGDSSGSQTMCWVLATATLWPGLEQYGLRTSSPGVAGAR